MSGNAESSRCSQAFGLLCVRLEVQLPSVQLPPQQGRARRPNMCVPCVSYVLPSVLGSLLPPFGWVGLGVVGLGLAALGFRRDFRSVFFDDERRVSREKRSIAWWRLPLIFWVQDMQAAMLRCFSVLPPWPWPKVTPGGQDIRADRSRNFRSYLLSVPMTRG